MTGKKYHLHTAYTRFALGGHAMDWANQPSVFKRYPTVDSVILPQSSRLSDRFLTDVAVQNPESAYKTSIDADTVYRMIFAANGLTAKSRFQKDSYFYYRSAASAGALYPNELYFAAYALEGIDPGVYHCDIARMRLERLRSGDFRNATSDADRNDPDGARIASFFISGIFFRSAWKYRARAFRYILLDAGHVLQNLLLALRSEGVDHTVCYDFSDESLGMLLGLDPEREACLACVHVLGNPSTAPAGGAAPERLPEEVTKTGQTAPREIVYSEILAAYRRGGAIVTPENNYTDNICLKEPAIVKWLEIPKPKVPLEDELSFGETIVRRRSKRNFVSNPMRRDHFDALLNLLFLAANFGCVKNRGFPLTVFALIEAVEGCAPGLYLLDIGHLRLGLMLEKPLATPMARICLDQMWLKNAAVNFIFSTSLDFLEKNWGPRGYRHAMLEAGRLGEMVYLGATALGMGCCGIGAFYDAEAAQLLALEKDAAVLYLTAAGPVKG